MHRSTRRILTTHHLRRFEPAPSLPQFPRKQTLLLHVGISLQGQGTKSLRDSPLMRGLSRGHGDGG